MALTDLAPGDKIVTTTGIQGVIIVIIGLDVFVQTKHGDFGLDAAAIARVL